MQYTGAAGVIGNMRDVFHACASTTGNELTAGQSIGGHSPSNGISNCSIKASRDNNEARVELVGNGQQHMLECSHVIPIAHLPFQPGHIDREALPGASTRGLSSTSARIEPASAGKQACSSEERKKRLRC